MAKTTMKDLEARMDNLENTLSEIVKTLNSLNKAINGTIPEGQSSDGTNKDTPNVTNKYEGKLVNSKKGITLKITIEDGKGKGTGKKFIKILFSEKPSDKVTDSLKLKGFKDYNLDHSWSTYKTDSKLAFAQSLIKDEK